MQPVHSWKCSQITEGFRPLSMAWAICTATLELRPTDAAAIEITFRKSRRSIGFLAADVDAVRRSSQAFMDWSLRKDSEHTLARSGMSDSSGRDRVDGTAMS